MSERTTIVIESADESYFEFSGSTLEEAQRKLSEWLSKGQKDMVGFLMNEDDETWLVALVNIVDGPNAGKWHISEAPPGEPSMFDTFESARDQFVALAGKYAASTPVVETRSHLLAGVIFTEPKNGEST